MQTPLPTASLFLFLLLLLPSRWWLLLGLDLGGGRDLLLRVLRAQVLWRNTGERGRGHEKRKRTLIIFVKALSHGLV